MAQPWQLIQKNIGRHRYMLTLKFGSLLLQVSAWEILVSENAVTDTEMHRLMNLKNRLHPPKEFLKIIENGSQEMLQGLVNALQRIGGNTSNDILELLQDPSDEDKDDALQRALQKGSRRVCRSRVAFVGHYAAGKTSLKKRLLNEGFTDEYVETNSIEIEEKVEITPAKGWMRRKDEDDVIHFMADFTCEEMSRKDLPQNEDIPGRSRQTRESVTADRLNNTINEEQRKCIKQNVHQRRMDDLSEADLFLWDFGGQREFYVTHMTFMTLETIYIVVMDMTKPLDEVLSLKTKDGRTIIDSFKRTAGDYLDYWCSCIQTFVSTKENKPAMNGQVAMPPVVIVCTHSDVENADPEHVKKIKEHIKDKPYCNHINEDIFTISNKNPDQDDIKKIQDKISALAKLQTYDVPTAWIQFKEKMTTNYIKNLQEAVGIGREVGLKDESEVRKALQFFHGMGELIYFDEDELSEFIITDPQWLIDQFKKVITIPEKEPHFSHSAAHYSNLRLTGILDGTVLENVWSEDYREKLIRLMKKFALLCEIKSSELPNYKKAGEASELFLIPCLVPKASESQSEEDAIRPVSLTTTSYFVPIGLTSRLIAGLINEDQWKLLRISKDAATFLPKVPNPCINIRIKGTENKIEVCGIEVDEDEPDCDFSEFLDTLRERLDIITSTVCPQQSFNVQIHCERCEAMASPWDEEMLKREVEQFTESIFCRGHQKKWKTKAYERWFSNKKADDIKETDEPFITTQIKEVSKDMLKRLKRIKKDGEKPYRMERKPRGRAIIFNFQKFEHPFEDRKGSEVDVKNVECLFKDLGFEVVIHNDLSNLKHGRLVHLKEDGTAGRIHKLNGSTCVIGRKKDADFRINNRRVSKQHCEIQENQGQTWQIRVKRKPTFFKKKKTTLLNEVEVTAETTELRHGDVLTIGERYRFRFDRPPGPSVEDVIKEEQKHVNHGTSDAFILCTMSHGCDGYIVDHMWNPMHVNKTFVSPFNSDSAPLLAKKPKLFLSICCRRYSERKDGDGDNAEGGEEDADNEPWPEDSGPKGHPEIDMLVINSTVEGDGSIRHTEKGTYVVREVVNVFRARAHERDVSRMMHEVNDRLRKKDPRILSSVTDQLKGRMYFLPGYSKSMAD